MATAMVRMSTSREVTRSSERRRAHHCHFHLVGLRFEAVRSSLPVAASSVGETQIGGGKGQFGIGWRRRRRAAWSLAAAAQPGSDLAVRSPRAMRSCPQNNHRTKLADQEEFR
jgi:hypothetical protein